MKKILFTILLIFIFSCSDNETSYNENILIKRIISTSTQGSVTSTFFYIDNKLEKIIDDDGFAEYYYYTNNNITKIEMYENNILYKRREFVYDNSGKVILCIINDITNDINTNIILTYNSTQSINYSVSTTFSGQNTTTVNYIATLVDGEISTFNVEGSNISYNITHDLNNTWYKNILGLSKILIVKEEDGYGDLIGIYRNIIGIRRNNTIIKTIQYNYNSSGFPISSIETNTSNGTTQSIENSSYFYE